MEIEQAIEMSEALTSDNEHSISTLGSYGDEIAVLLLSKIIEQKEAIDYLQNMIDESCEF